VPDFFLDSSLDPFDFESGASQKKMNTFEHLVDRITFSIVPLRLFFWPVALFCRDPQVLVMTS
jgi:hypothetical protein